VEYYLKNDNESFDTLRPDIVLKDFIDFLKELTDRYDYNLNTEEYCNDQTQDLLHYMELHKNLNARDGYVIYKKLAEIRRKRRECSQENEVLKSIYVYINSPNGSEFMKMLQKLFVDSREKHNFVSSREFRPKTSVLENLF
jgi:hypothetical protein